MNFVYPFPSYPLHRFRTIFRASVDAIESASQAQNDPEWEMLLEKSRWRAEWAMLSLDKWEASIKSCYENHEIDVTDSFRKYARAYLNAFLKYRESLTGADGMVSRTFEFRFHHDA